MKNVDFLIIGGSAAGTTAAETIRDHVPQASISIITDEPHEQYSRVLLPHYLRHKVAREQVYLKKPAWYEERKIELLKGDRAQSLEVSKKTVKLSNGQDIVYGKLLIAGGGDVVRLGVPGADLVNILYMRTIEDADKIIAACGGSKKGVVVGGGFIGMEFISAFKLNGVEDVTVLVRDPYYWAKKLDEVSSKALVAVLERQGVKVFCGEDTERFEKRGSTSFVGAVVTKSGKKFEADVVGVGIGIKPIVEWLEGSGIKINHGIVTNEYLETNLPDVFAAGDIAEFHDVLFGRQHMLGNWANAASQGATAAKNMCQEKTVFETASSYSINFFDGACTFIGVTDADFADEIISRSPQEGKVTRIFIKTIGGVMRAVGATLINNPVDAWPLTVAVRDKIDISAHKDKFADPAFDLKSLIEQ